MSRILQALAWFVPGLAAVAIAALGSHPLMLIPLLLANALTMAAVCHAIGFDPEPRFGRTVLRRGAAHLVMFTGYVALVFLLVAWPLLQLSQGHDSGTLLLLGGALLLALAALWRIWPAYGLAFVWDDAYPAQSDGSWIFTAIARCLAFGRHLSRQERFFTHFLPAAFSLLVLAFMAIALTGLYGMLPAELRIAALAIYGVVLLPLGCLVIANRTLRVLLCEGRRPRRAEAVAETSAPAAAANASPLLSEPERVAGSAEQSTGLIVAARSGNIPRALALLDAGADPDLRPLVADHDQRSVLTLAALLSDMRLLRALIAKGAKLNAASSPDHRGMSVLLSTARDGGPTRAETIMTLITNGADVTAVDGEGNTALHHTARRDDLAVAAMLIDAEAPLGALNAEGQTPLAVACQAANWPLAELMLARRPPLQPAGGEPALVAAADIADDDPRGVALLLKHKAQINARDALGRTALIVAAQEGHARIAKALLTAHANVALADQHGTTALMEAAHHGAENIVRALCEAGAPLDARDRHGRDALTLACLSPHAVTGTVHALLDAGADPTTQADEDGQSAIECAAAEGRWDLLAILDPEAPLPATASTPDAAADESPAHLLDALRFGHWAIAAGFVDAARRWPPTDLAALYVELADSEHATARRWLLTQSLSPEQRLAAGTSLLDALLEKLPASRLALHELLAAGASPAGAGRLAIAMHGLAATPAEGLALAATMLDRGADPFSPLADGRTPLHLASAPGWLALLQRLADLGCDPNMRDEAGRTPLHDTLEHPAQAAAVRCLIGAGADPEAIAANGETPLGLTLAHEASDSERWLRWAQWPLPRRRLRAHDLPAAATAGDLTAVDKLLELGFSPDTRDPKGTSALIHACGLGHEAVAARLLDAGADIGLSTPGGITPLAAAAGARHLALIRLLVQRQVVVDQPLNGQATALMLACALGHPEVAEALAEAGADVNACDALGHAPLHAAAQYAFGSRDSLRARRLLDVLLSHKVDVNKADASGMTPLLLLLGAQQKPGTESDATHLGALVPVLLEAGADLQHADQRGVTALHACAMHALLAPARLLLARGADRAAVDAFGRTAADVARHLGYIDIAHELAARVGAIPSVRQTLRQPAQPAE